MNGKTILIVDDEIPIAEMFRMILDAAGYTTIMTHNAGDVPAILSSSAVDLMILDVMMPGTSGFDLIREVHKMDRLARLPVIFVSAKSDPDDVDEGMGAGALAYLTKPVSRAELLAAVERVFKEEAAR